MHFHRPQFIGFLLLCSYPAFAIDAAMLPEQSPPAKIIGQKPLFQKLLTEDHALSYDAIAELMDQIENDTLICSPQEWDQIAEFLAYLARQGSDSGIDKAILERDIQEMQEASSVLEASYFLGSQKFVLAPFIDDGGMDALLCKNWFSKKWKHVKHFVKHHKTAVIIGSIVVVAAVAVVIAVASTAAAAGGVAAAATGAAAGVNSSSSKSEISQQTVQPQVEEQISSIKTMTDQSSLLSSSSMGNLKVEEARAIGSTLAHEALSDVPSISSDGWDRSVIIGHGAIDNAFSTDLSIRYINPTPSLEVDNRWQSNVFISQGEQALKQQNFESAVEHFGKAIEADPQNHDAYLERATAYMELGEYNNSLNDYRMYTSHEQPNQSFFSNTIDFGVGFAQGLPKGVGESGHQLLTFASEMATHPIETTSNVCAAFSNLAKLTASQEWGALSQSLAPEVCQLISEWETLPAREQGERAGYIFGKFGGDILIPGATAKVLSKGINGAKELALAAKNLQTAEQTFALETLSQSARSPATFTETTTTLSAAKSPFLKLEDIVVQSKNEAFLRSQGLWDSFVKCKKAEIYLGQFKNKCLTETEIRSLIHETGMSTFPRPAGIPEHYQIMLADRGAGMKYVRPGKDEVCIRVMPGKPHSPNPMQQKPYVTVEKDGYCFDKYGNSVKKNSPEAHIPLDEFVYRGY